MTEIIEDAIEDGSVYLESGFYSKEDLEEIIETMDRLKSYVKDMINAGMSTKH